jgi:hypothetical protein
VPVEECVPAENNFCGAKLEKTKGNVAEHKENPAGFKRQDKEVPF